MRARQTLSRSSPETPRTARKLLATGSWVLVTGSHSIWQ